MPAASTHARSFPTGAETLLSQGLSGYWGGWKREMLKTKNTQKSVCVFEKNLNQLLNNSPRGWESVL